MKKDKNVYVWYSPRGFANEGKCLCFVGGDTKGMPAVWTGMDGNQYVFHYYIDGVAK